MEPSSGQGKPEGQKLCFGQTLVLSVKNNRLRDKIVVSPTPPLQRHLFLNLRISLRHGRRGGDACEVTKP